MLPDSSNNHDDEAATQRRRRGREVIPPWRYETRAERDWWEPDLPRGGYHDLLAPEPYPGGSLI